MLFYLPIYVSWSLLRFPRISWLLFCPIGTFGLLYPGFLDHIRVFRCSRILLMLEKRVSRNIRNIRGRIVGRHPVDYFENIITKRSSSPRRRREGIAGSVAGNAKEERRRKRDWKERASPTWKKRLYTRTFHVSTVLHSVALLSLILRRRCVFHSSSESWLVMGRTMFIIRVRTLQLMCPRLIFLFLITTKRYGWFTDHHTFPRLPWWC